MITRMVSARKRLTLIGVAAGLTLGGMTSLVTVSANTGTVTPSESCTTWSVVVDLNNNVQAGDTVSVITNLPGTPGFTHQPYTTTSNPGPVQIWSDSGPAPQSGTVTLTIYDSGGGVQDSVSTSITPVTSCPHLTITKTPDATSVDAGSPIGFTITLHNAGPGESTGTTLNDPLPSGSGISWTIASQSGPVTCSITAGTLSCGTFTLASSGVNATETVHVVSATTVASCAAYDNTASFTSENGGSGSSAQASETVSCPLTGSAQAITSSPTPTATPSGGSLAISTPTTGSGPLPAVGWALGTILILLGGGFLVARRRISTDQIEDV